MDLKEKAALVTGATSGIGKEIAKALLTEGAKVAVNYRSDDQKKEETERDFETLLTVAGRPSSDLLMVKADVSKPAQVQKMFAAIDKRFDSLDLLVNNAGIQSETPSHELETGQVEKEIAVNLTGPILCCCEALKRFLKKPRPHGSIVNVSSVHEEVPKPGFLPYSVSKGGLRNLTRTLALEYADKNIRVNAVGPGTVDTNMNSKLSDPKVRKETQRNIPLKRIVQAKEVARSVLFLASDAARNITGQTLFMDGGLSLYPSFQDNWTSK
ncbi:SDR family oxidoreductase [Pelagicoccus sp. NFK12]|uniref:SDR family oxidoreductase n=1 Tax=Pelagicoccus enzymogenes TaxID=2773457 RepID=A0A927IHS3_9BACT|nr:SDR family oxidoreductase [Pelagicoccus enzymogenes]MBD5780104.1 SDR family oxidoreductase [Pelagicoccus enzymogenes]